MTTYTICNKATARVAQALADALGVPLVPYDQFYLSMQGRYAKTRREQIEALLDLVNKGLAVHPEALKNATYSDGGSIFKVHSEVTDIIVLNPWTGAQKVTTVKDVLRSIETFATSEECEAVNDVFIGDNVFDWVKTFEEIHGLDRLSAIAFS